MLPNLLYIDSLHSRDGLTFTFRFQSLEEPTIHARAFALENTSLRYDVGRANCHHMAKLLFNTCAIPKAKVHRMPNAFLTGIANCLQVGFVPS
jgi:hypothetical protein